MNPERAKVAASELRRGPRWLGGGGKRQRNDRPERKDEEQKCPI